MLQSGSAPPSPCHPAASPAASRRGSFSSEVAPGSGRPWYWDLWLGPCGEVWVRFSVLFAVGANVLVFPFLLAFEGAIRRGDGAFGVFSLCDVILWLDWLLIFITPIWDEEAAALLSHRATAARYLRSGDLLLDLFARCPWDAIVTGSYAAPRRDSPTHPPPHPHTPTPTPTLPLRSRADSSTLSFGHLARLLTMRRALYILHSRVGSGGAARRSRRRPACAWRPARTRHGGGGTRLQAQAQAPPPPEAAARGRRRLDARSAHVAALRRAPPRPPPHRAGPRFVGPLQRLVTLCSVSLVVLHWYACLMWLLSERLRKAGRESWTAKAAYGEWDGTTELWPWPQWAQYLHSFDRGLTCILSGAVRGGTHDETALALAGQLAAVAWLAYFTSTMVQLVTNMSASSELARSKIGRVSAFCRHARIPVELNRRVKAHLEHVLLAKKLALDTNELPQVMTRRPPPLPHTHTHPTHTPLFVGISKSTSIR